MAAAKQHLVETNRINLSVTEAGTGPLVILCHGWPELSHSWRHQIPALAAAGYRVVAPDMRGYGKSDAPDDIAAYHIFNLVGDVVGLVSALGETSAVIVGHDWGANVAWHAALFRPDLFHAVATMSVPFRQRGPAPPLEMLRAAGLDNFYWIYFQEPGVAEAEFERDPTATLRRILYSGSGDAPRREGMGLALKKGGGFLDNTREPERLPPWLPQADLDHMAAEFRRTGFRGGLNWYRNIDRNWALAAPWHGARVQVPALFIAGSSDVVIHGPAGKSALEQLETTVPQLRRKLLIEGAGHWVQQERPTEVNAALIEFLKGL